MRVLTTRISLRYHKADNPERDTSVLCTRFEFQHDFVKIIGQISDRETDICQTVSVVTFVSSDDMEDSPHTPPALQWEYYRSHILLTFPGQTRDSGGELLGQTDVYYNREVEIIGSSEVL